MIKLYNKRVLKGLLSYLLLCCTLLILRGDMYGQEFRPFKPRTSTKAKDIYKQGNNYYLKGDFLMLGNTNFYFRNPSDINNAKPLAYVDIDNDPTTFNSSSAELKLPNGDCGEIVYAGLYWTTHPSVLNKGNNVWEELPFLTYNGTRYDYNKLKFKKEGKPYIDIIAEDFMKIKSPNHTDLRGFIGYVDVTDYVIKNGYGNYFVADMAGSIESHGNNGIGDNNFGGWGMVVVYKDTAAPWRYITVFDGAYFISSSTYPNIDIPISGFRSNSIGQVNANIGLMAGEGDFEFEGDYFAIFNKGTNSYERLSHINNNTNNFFNSSILTGSNSRNPNYTNNAGFDLVKFPLLNVNNKFIKNNDTSALFRAGSTLEDFFLFSFVIGIDAYQTDVIAENKVKSGAVDNGTVGPGQEIEWDLTVRNVGNESIKNGFIEIPIPPSLHYVSSSVDQTKDIKGTVTWTPPNGATSTDPSKVPGGKLVWKFDKDVAQGDINKILGKITYKLKVVNCMILSSTANGCMTGMNFNGTVGGVGTITGSDVKIPLVKIPGICGDRDENDFRVNYSVPSCPGVVNGVKIYEEYCTVPANIIKRATIINDYPPGTKFYSMIPGTANYKQSEITGDFPSSSTGILYYAIAPGAVEDCYMKLSAIYKGITSTPTVNNVSFCFGQPVVLNNQPSKAGLKLYYYDSATATTPLTSPPAPTTVGTHTYYVAEGEYINGADCIGPRKSFTITVFVLPSVTTVLEPIDLCVNMNYAVTINTENAVEYWIEYTLPSAPTVWKKHDANSFPNGQLSFKVGGILTFTNITKDLDKVTLRVAVRSVNGCIGYSNPFPITVTDCGGIVNPMLLTPAGK